MKAYIVIEWNGETYEDNRSYPVAVYLDAVKAGKSVKEFNESKNTPPIPIPKEEFIPNEFQENYEEYILDLQNDWERHDSIKRQHIQEIEITE